MIELDDSSMKGKWMTKKGKVMKVKDMTTQHLIHTIRLLRRRAIVIHQKAVDNAINMVGCVIGEMATYYADQQYDRLVTTDPVDYLHEMPVFEALWDELEKRLDKEGKDIYKVIGDG